jgi:hypothetical protein
LAVPGRRYGEFAELLQPLHTAAAPEGESVAETSWEGLRLIVAHNPQRAQEQTDKRTARIAALEARAKDLANKLDGQDAGQKKRGRKLSDSGAKARFFHEVADAHLSKIIKIDLKSDLFTYDIDAKALARAQMMDGKLLLATNVATPGAIKAPSAVAGSAAPSGAAAPGASSASTTASSAVPASAASRPASASAGTATVSPPTPAFPAASSLGTPQLDAMSEQDLAALLAEELKSLRGPVK